MFAPPSRRILVLWLPRFASDRALRGRPAGGPFALSQRLDNTERIYCLNAAASAQGLVRGMPLAEARAFCAGLVSRPASPAQDAQGLQALRRWATGFCPWVGLEPPDGLVLDITGSAHLRGGEAALVADLRAALGRAGYAVRLGLADSYGGAWALARHAEGIAPPGGLAAALAALPVAGLRLLDAEVTALQRLGLRRIGALAAAPRAPLARRFGPGLLRRLDQALGQEPEPITPPPDPMRYAVRLTLPEPIGLAADVMAGAARLLEALCARLQAQAMGARALQLSLRRVDQAEEQVLLRLAAPMRDAARILPLFARGVEAVDAGFGIDQLRLEAIGVEPMAAAQIGLAGARARPEALETLLSRLGSRVGLEHVRRYLPQDSHIPEGGFALVPVESAGPMPAPAPASAPASAPGPGLRSAAALQPWRARQARPLVLFPPEPIEVEGAPAPRRFVWRRMRFTTARATGPERIQPEWWHADPGWRQGLRDYWRIETREGRRLWLFHTPQAPGWFVQGEFA